MPVLKGGVISPDTWLNVATDDTLPKEGAIIVGLGRWLAERDELLKRNTALGVRIEPGDDLTKIRDDIARFDVIAVVFPRFRDGRGFSIGRLLRERYGFKGELRALGDILRDQFLFLHRCGYDAIEVKENMPLDEWHTAMNEFSVWYQPTADGRQSVLRRRHK